MKAIRPDHDKPLAGAARGQKPASLGQIAVRFLILLTIAIVLLMLAWHR